MSNLEKRPLGDSSANALSRENALPSESVSLLSPNSDYSLPSSDLFSSSLSACGPVCALCSAVESVVSALIYASSWDTSRPDAPPTADFVSSFVSFASSTVNFLVEDTILSVLFPSF